MHVLFLWKIKEASELLAHFKKSLDESYRKPIKSQLQDSDIEIYSAHNREEYVVAERVIRTLKNKIWKYMTAMSNSMYNDKLDDIVNWYNNTEALWINLLRPSLNKLEKSSPLKLFN